MQQETWKLCPELHDAQSRIVSATQLVNSKIADNKYGLCVLYTMGWACDSFKTASSVGQKDDDYRNIYEANNVFIFSRDKLVCYVGLDYVADIVSVSDDGTQILLGSSQSGTYDHFCVTVEAGRVCLTLKAHMQYSDFGKTRALCCTKSCALIVDSFG